MEGFTHTMALDLNMGYYTIRLDPNAILPCGTYSYLWLPIEIAGSQDIFQEKMFDLMRTLGYIFTCLGDLVNITRGIFNNHLTKLREVLWWLLKASLLVNAVKSNFDHDKIKYHGYTLTREGFKPQPEKVVVHLAQPPQFVKELRTFLGLVQYIWDLWEKCIHLLVSLTVYLVSVVRQ